MPERRRNVQRGRAEMADFPFGDPSDGPLSAEDVRAFCTEGYVVVKGFYSETRAAELRTRASAVLTAVAAEGWELPPDAQEKAIIVARDPWAAANGREGDALNPGRVRFVNSIHHLDAELAAHYRDPKMMAAMRQLLGPDVNGGQCCTVTKPAGVNFEWHGWCAPRACVWEPETLSLSLSLRH